MGHAEQVHPHFSTTPLLHRFTLPLTRRESVSRYYRFQPVVIALARMVL
jgi:hypothetical protein